MAVKVTRKPTPPTHVQLLTSSREMSTMCTDDGRVTVNVWEQQRGAQRLAAYSSFAAVELREWCAAVIEMIDAQ